MAQNIGTLISASIRPNDSLDPIASAFASEIKGGLHTATSSTDRNNIIFERREWGMMCYVVNDNQTYQLKYGLQDTNIMNNNNWEVFNGSGGGGGEWLDSVIAIQNDEPISPNDGDRYIIGQSPTGTNWISLSPNLVVQWNSTLSQWDQTFPTDETSVRVDNEDNAIYNYEGNWPTGQWYKERLGQVRDILAITSNGEDYISTSEPPFNGYTSDLIFLTKFSSNNISGTVSLDVNGLGSIQLKKPSPSGLLNLNPNDLVTGVVYSITFDGTYFQINRPYTNDDIFSIKYYIEPTDYIVVPQYYQYWVYSDLEIAGNLVNYGHVIIANGSLILSGGTFSNFGSLAFVTFNAGLTTSYNNSNTIQFTQSNTIFGLSVSAIVADNSLTASKLDVINSGSASQGWTLAYNNSGQFEWTDPYLIGDITEIITDNGLSGGGLSGSVTISLGGTLSQNTQIEASGYDFTLGDADTILFTSSVFDVETDGIISLDGQSIQILADDTITLSSFDTIDVVSNNLNLSFVTGSVTSINGEGLVYTQDYSGTFVTNSLITKQYVDNSLSTLINGITVSGPTAGLGGSLYRDTTIDGSGYNFTIGNADTILFTSSVFDVEGYGIISLDAVTGSVQILAEDSVTIASSNTGIASSGNLNLSFVTGSVTDNSGNGLGLVYTQDYSGTFVTNSLVSKLYVDNSLSSLINGITVSGPTAGLGGSLYRDTTIDGSGYDFTLGDVGVILFTSSIFDVETDGIISLDGQSMQILADDTITLSSFDTIDVVSNNLNFVFSTGSVTSINGEGLVYTSDYSGTFVTNSLITKNYVDNSLSSLINGITVSGPTAGLGGSLYRDTTIDGSGYNFTIGNAGIIQFTSSVFDVETNGLISLDAGIGSIQVLADDDITISSIAGNIDIISSNNLNLSFVTGSVTDSSGNGLGLVYTSDYSGTFITNSLVSKLYVDNAVQTIVTGSAQPVYQLSTASVTTGNDSTTGVTLSNTPNDYSRIEVYINGIKQRLGDGVTTLDCYISSTASTAESLSNLVSGQTLYWNGTISGFDLQITDIVEIVYEA